MTLRGENLSLAGRLDGVSATLEPGRITAICGPNGAGKSTLIEMLAGLLTPEIGAVTIDGTPLAHLHPRERAKRIGYLPQEPVLAWDVSVRNLVALGRLPFRDRGTAQVEAALEACDCTRFADRPVSTLSGGERARVLLARVLAGEPQWILADEPFAALDIGHQLALARQLAAQRDAGRGVLLVVHDLALAMNRVDRVIVLDEGRLAADGTPPDALSPDVLRDVWHIDAAWIGEPGARALVTR